MSLHGFAPLDFHFSKPDRYLQLPACGAGKHKILFPACDDGRGAAALRATKREFLHRQEYALKCAQYTGADEQAIESQDDELKRGFSR